MVRRWIYWVFIPVVIGAVGFLAYLSFKTTLNIDLWGIRTIVDSTYGVAREKSQRIEQKIIDSDNAFLSIIDMENLEDLRERWEQLSSVSTSVDSVFIIDENRSVIFSVSDRTGQDIEHLTSIFQDILTPLLKLDDGKTTTLQHLHTKFDGGYYLVSYKSTKSVKSDDVWYTVCLNYNVNYLRNTFLPDMFADLAPTKLYNVVDSEGRLVFGSRIKESGEFIVGWRIPSTLYDWRIQVAPTPASYYEATSRKKQLYDIFTVAIAFAVVFLGIAMLIYMAEQERRLGRLKSEFIANVSHELKTPLSIIRLFSDMLSMGKIKDPEKEKRYLLTISREGERLTALIDNVLDFSKMEGGMLAYQMTKADITQAVNSAIEISKFKLDQEKINLVVDIDDSLPEVSHDPHAITLAVLNLLDNAVKYADGTDRVAVSVKGDNGRVNISVKDWGRGVTKFEKRHLFDRFFRGKEARQKHQRGTGIGLTLVKSIIDSHGGKIKVSSPIDDSGKGTEFSITI
ncbi:MAG: HAMP domain-containing sensor histidine kinase [Pseudomonadota bacterium]